MHPLLFSISFLVFLLYHIFRVINVKLLNTYELEIKKSKFLAYLYEIDNQKEVKEIWNQLKKEHKKARHIPYAYVFYNTAGKSDDKEPSGTSASPIYQNLMRSNQNHHAVFVVRYFGGIKLGAGGLIRAYNEAANQVLEKNDSF